MLWIYTLTLVAASPIAAPKVLNLDVVREYVVPDAGVPNADVPNADVPDKRDAIVQDIDSIRTQPCYRVEIDIGSLKRPCKMWLDTGSYYSWVRQELYDYANSTTAEKGGKYTAGYIGGGTSGFWVSDKASLPSGQEFDYKFGQTSVTKGYLSNFDGILGIATHTLGDDPENKSIINSLYRSQHINSRSFGLWLGSHGNGSIAFGGIDQSKYKGDLTVVPFWPDGGFGLPVRKWYGFDTEGNRILLAEGGQKCAIDTGSGVASFPAPFVDAFKRAFNFTLAANVPEALKQGFTNSTWVAKYQGHSGYSLDVAGLVLDIPMAHWLEDEKGINLKGEATVGRYYGLNLQTGGCLIGSHHFFHNYYVVANYDRMEFAIGEAVQDTESMGASHLQTLGPDAFSGFKSAPVFEATTKKALTAYTTYFPGDGRATSSV